MNTTLRSIELFHLEVPLKTKIKHASHSRETSDNLVVKATLSNGQVGYGEGVPRSYVTGETIESSFECLGKNDLGRLLGSIATPDDLITRLSGLSLEAPDPSGRCMGANAAGCALEIALLDAFGQVFGLSVQSLVRLGDFPGVVFSQRPTNVRYSGAITAADPRKERIGAWKMRIYGFHQVKIKVGVDGQDDPVRLRKLRKILGRRMDIRIDANEAWSPSELLARVEPLRAANPSALEQPVAHADVQTLAALRPQLGIPVMLDESLCSEIDGRAAIRDKTCDIFNVRLSKCGGLLASLRLVAMAKRAGLDVQLGCHPGETGLLSAAGRHVASNVLGLRYVEGSYDRHVLARNLTYEDITFRYGGWAKPILRPGLGVTVNPESLAEMTRNRREVSYE